MSTISEFRMYRQEAEIALADGNDELAVELEREAAFCWMIAKDDDEPVYPVYDGEGRGGSDA
jgi:hypothetical protein